jgi:hypothetical protein
MTRTGRVQPLDKTGSERDACALAAPSRAGSRARRTDGHKLLITYSFMTNLAGINMYVTSQFGFYPNPYLDNFLYYPNPMQIRMVFIYPWLYFLD